MTLLSVRLFLLGHLFASLSSANIVQGNEVSQSPAALELVFPIVLQGPLPLKDRNLIFESRFLIDNPAAEDAYLEIELFEAQEDSSQLNRPGGPILQMIPRVVPAGSRTILSLGLEPAADLVSGWARVRSNQSLIVLQQLTIQDPDRPEPTTDRLLLASNPVPLKAAEIAAIFNVGNPLQNTGISLVNASAVEPLQVNIELMRHRLQGRTPLAVQQMTVAAGGRFDFIAAGFFSEIDLQQLAGEACSVECSVGIVRISTEGSGRFAVAALDYRVGSVDEGGKEIPFVTYQPNRSFDMSGVAQVAQEAAGGPWGFPLSTVRSESLFDWKLALTPFHLELTPAAGSTLVVPVSPGEELILDDELGVAVVAGHREKLVWIPEHPGIIRIALEGELRQILGFPERGQLEIEAEFLLITGLTPIPVSNYVLIDRSSGAVVDRFVHDRLSGPVLPPWRD